MRISQGRESGFTLIEIIVAITILAMGIATFSQLVSGALRSSSLARDYTKAATLAKSKLYELSTEIPLSQISERGTFEEDERFRWERTVSVRLNEEGSRVIIYRVQVKVLFSVTGMTEKEVSLSTFVTRVSKGKESKEGSGN